MARLTIYFWGGRTRDEMRRRIVQLMRYGWRDPQATLGPVNTIPVMLVKGDDLQTPPMNESGAVG